MIAHQVQRNQQLLLANAATLTRNLEDLEAQAKVRKDMHHDVVLTLLVVLCVVLFCWYFVVMRVVLLLFLCCHFVVIL